MNRNLSVVVPFYNKPTQEGICICTIRNWTEYKGKYYAYNIPIFVGVNMELETVRRLAEIPQYYWNQR